MTGRGVVANAGQNGGPRRGSAAYQPNGRWSAGSYDNPDNVRFRGDFVNFDRAVSFDSAHYTFVYLDCFNQHRFTRLPRPYGVNWVFDMLRCYQKKQRMPELFHQIRVLTPLQLVKYFSLMFYGLHVATGTTNISLNLCGFVLDEYNRAASTIKWAMV